MDYGLYSKIKERDLKALRGLQVTELPFAYFICYRIKGNVSEAAKLLKLTWIAALSGILSGEKCPSLSFRGCLAKEIWRLSDEPLPEMEDEDIFEAFEVPRLDRKFDAFTEEIDRMEPRERGIYLLNRLCDLGNDENSALLRIPLQEAKQYLYSLEKKAHPCETRDDFRKLIPLNNAFKSTNGELFETVSVPELFVRTMEHDYEKNLNFSGKKS